jgi:hypothetical protein
MIDFDLRIAVSRAVCKDLIYMRNLWYDNIIEILRMLDS